MNKNNHTEEVAKMLGVDLKEEFKVKPTEFAQKRGFKIYKEDEGRIFRFDDELSVKGYDDGWSEWYGSNDRVLYFLIIGMYEIVKGGD